MKKNIPNFLTMANLFCGVVSILLITREEYLLATYFFIFSLIFDFFDGFSARLLKVNSDLGLQLDSMADMVSFGVAPAMIMYNLMFRSLTSVNYNFNIFIIGDTNIPLKALFAFFIAVYSGLRLAKFNIDTRQTTNFIGLPTPANSIFIYSLPLIIMYYPDTFIGKLIDNYNILLVITLIFSFLLIAEIRLFSLKIKTVSFGENKYIYSFLLISLIFIYLFKLIAIPFVIIIYILMSIIENLIEHKSIK